MQNDDLASRLGLDNLPPEELEETLSQISSQLVESITMRAIPLMTPAEQVRYEDLLTGGASPDEVYAFLAEHVQELPKIAEEEAERIRDIIASTLPPGENGK